MKNKYLVVVGALAAQLTIGALYAWSIFGKALELENFGTANQIFWTYAIAQFVFALTTILSGRLVDRRGPKLVITIGGILYGGGLVLSSFATTPTMLYLTFGILSGAGVGFVYVCPLATLIKWFPKNKGAITGLSVSVFGGGSILFKQIISFFTESANASVAFLYLGLISAATIILGAQFVSLPEGYSKAHATKGDDDFLTSEMVKTPKFYKTWIMYWLAVTPGLLVLGAAKNIGLEVAGLTAITAGGLISILAIANASSRLISGSLSDKLGTLNVLKALLGLTILSLLSLSFLGANKAMFYFGVVGIAFGYGGFLALFPTFTNQQFGSFRYASNYGVIYQAYGLAALSGIFIKSVVGSFTNTFIVAALAGVVGLIISFFIKERKA